MKEIFESRYSEFWGCKGTEYKLPPLMGGTVTPVPGAAAVADGGVTPAPLGRIAGTITPAPVRQLKREPASSSAGAAKKARHAGPESAAGGEPDGIDGEPDEIEDDIGAILPQRFPHCLVSIAAVNAAPEGIRFA